jgi:gluconolactonase
VLAHEYEGKRFGGPNDVVVRSDGSIYFTDTFGGMFKLENDPSKELDINAIYMIREGKVIRVVDDIPNTNGLAFSPDETVMYANGSLDRYIRRYDVTPDGALRNGALLIDFAGEKARGITDGMKVDKLGNLWTTGPGGIWIVSPGGKPLGLIPLPEGGTNLTFGDDDRKTLYISAETSIYKIRTNVAGLP